MTIIGNFLVTTPTNETTFECFSAQSRRASDKYGTSVSGSVEVHDLITTFIASLLPVASLLAVAGFLSAP